MKKKCSDFFLSQELNVSFHLQPVSCAETLLIQFRPGKREKIHENVDFVGFPQVASCAQSSGISLKSTNLGFVEQLQVAHLNDLPPVKHERGIYSELINCIIFMLGREIETYIVVLWVAWDTFGCETADKIRIAVN